MARGLIGLVGFMTVAALAGGCSPHEEAAPATPVAETGAAPGPPDAAPSGPTPTKLAAIRDALRSNSRAELVPLLADADATVRHAALLAVGPAADGTPPVVAVEALFPHLHDTDGEVRSLAADILRGRGLTLAQISLARQLTHPDPAERMRLLTDLATDAAGDAVKDAGPWLERLSRDADPAVRLGTARVAYEMRLQFTGWLDTLATADPDPTVRRWAAYYQREAAAARQAGHTGR